MSTVNEFHHEAMEFASLALREQRYGNHEEALCLFQQALTNECAAIDALKEPIEPTYSILHRSAATLALDCNNLRKAEQLAARALSKEPQYISQELHDVLELARFRRRLKDAGLELQPGEIRLSLAGEAVGDCAVGSREIFGRLQSLERLVYRTIERLLEMPYRGKTPEKIRQGYPIFVSAPQTASFSVSLRLGSPLGTGFSSGKLETAKIVNEIQDLMDAISRSNMAGLQELIPSPEYLRDFLIQAKKIAPDGRRVREVGITSTGGGTCRSAILVRPAYEMPSPLVMERTSVGLAEDSG